MLYRVSPSEICAASRNHQRYPAGTALAFGRGFRGHSRPFRKDRTSVRVVRCVVISPLLFYAVLRETLLPFSDFSATATNVSLTFMRCHPNFPSISVDIFHLVVAIDIGQNSSLSRDDLRTSPSSGTPKMTWYASGQCWTLIFRMDSSGGASATPKSTHARQT